MYVRGSGAAEEIRPGWSDLDLALVLQGEPGRPGLRRDSARRRWQRVEALVPALGNIVDLAVYETEELAIACRSSTFLADRAVHLGPAAGPDEAGLLLRPGLQGAARDWRLQRGSERRPLRARADAHAGLIESWLELQFVWRYVFTACSRPSAPDAAYVCVKAVADSARIWLGLVHGETPPTRRASLEAALLRLPEEEQALRAALALEGRLHFDPPAPWAGALPVLRRMSTRIASHVTRRAEEQGTTDVGLQWDQGHPLTLPPGADPSLGRLADGDPELLPLVDWRARAWPLSSDEGFWPLALDPDDPEDLAAAVNAAGEWGPLPAIACDSLMILPGPGLLRAVQCPASDPVSFALLGGRSCAAFPNEAGWSASDSARRAVGEHRAWLGASPPGPGPLLPDWMKAQARTTAADSATIDRLLSAARAALFAQSLDSGQPSLPLTMDAAATALDFRTGSECDVAARALEHLVACRAREVRPDPRIIAALREQVLGLDVYRFEVT